jgi:DNA-binding MarR family transcriptional regulator
MPSSRPAGAAGLAAEAWRLLFDFFLLTRPQRDRALDRLGLTPNDVRAMATLASGEGHTMGTLAEAWSCDASNATWMVDRLEKRGLAERRAQAGDRRVKRVVLTAAGLKAKAELLRSVYEPPPELLAMPRATLLALRNAAAKLPRASKEGTPLTEGRTSRGGSRAGRG